MNFGLAIYTTPDINNYITISRLSEELKSFFEDKNYGSDIKSLTIGIHCLNIPPGFEKFSKLPKPRYTKGIKTINPDGIPFTLEDSFEYSVKIDFLIFNNASETEAKKILAVEILKSLSVLDEYKSKRMNFNTMVFKGDLEQYLQEKGLV